MMKFEEFRELVIDIAQSEPGTGDCEPELEALISDLAYVEVLARFAGSNSSLEEAFQDVIGDED